MAGNDGVPPARPLSRFEEVIMASTVKVLPSREEFEQSALDYYASLTLEDFMESTDQHTQSKITDASLDLVTRRWPEFQCLGELLIQYMHEDRIRKIVPDHLVLLSGVTIDKRRSLNLPYEDVRLIVVMEYVSDVNPKKDYRDSFVRYEQQLRVPYYLTFQPVEQDLRLHVHDGTAYVRAEPNDWGRLAIPELQLEAALLDGWTRFWFQGQLLPIPKEYDELMERQAMETRRQSERAVEAENRVEQEKQRADALAAELAQLRAQQQKPNGPTANGPQT
jgi:Uma2 family endonuclease